MSYQEGLYVHTNLPPLKFSDIPVPTAAAYESLGDELALKCMLVQPELSISQS